MKKSEDLLTIKDRFKTFVRFKELKKEQGFRKRKMLGNNLLYLQRKLVQNVNESGIENLGTEWMLQRMGDGNFKYSRRWAWLYRHYIWASRVTVPRANLVDIGCDVGEIRKIISKSFYTKNPLYVGIDLDHKRLSEGAERIQMQLPAIYVQQDVTLGFSFLKSNSVDMIFAGEIIEHFKKKFGRKLLKEIYRILKPGGKFILSTPNKKNSKGFEFHVYEYDIDELADMINKVGLKWTKLWGWTTTEKVILKRGSKGLIKDYNILKKDVHKDLVVPMMAYLEPAVSEAFCIEGLKPNS